MKKFVVVDVDIPQLQSNKMFDRALAGKVSHTILPLCYLYEQAKLEGIELMTPDVYEIRKAEPHRAALMSHMITGQTRGLISAGVKPILLYSQESPLIAFRFFVLLKKYARMFKNTMIFTGFRKQVESAGSRFYPMYFPEPYPAVAVTSEPWSSKKFLTMISGNKRVPFTWKRFGAGLLSGTFYREFYKERLAVIEYFADKGFDLFGMGWQKSMAGETPSLRSAINRCYKGPVDDKIATVRNYKFAFAFENTSAPGYVTEKIFDVMVSGSVPIYLGAPDIASFVPKAAFINMQDYASLADLENDLLQIGEERYNAYIAAINSFLQSAEYRKFTEVEFAKTVLSMFKEFFQTNSMNTKTPKVVIAIPTYNRLRFLKPCLESIKAQTFTDYVLYIFDDASTEPIESEARKIFGDKLVFVPSARNMGARNNIDRAMHYDYQSPYLVVFHDDDVMHPRMIEREVEMLEKFPEASFVGTNIRFVDDPQQMGTFAPSANAPLQYEYYPSATDLTRGFLRSIHLGFSSVMYRRSTITPDVHLERIEFGPNDDRPFLVSLAAGRGSIFIKNQLLNYRLHPGQDSLNNPQTGFISIAPMLMSFYRAQLPSPLSRTDKRLFLRFSTNGILDSFYRNAKEGDSLRAHLDDARKKQLFDARYINRVGIRSLLKIARKKLFSKKK